MALSVFTQRLGESQGRVVAGSQHSFVLGDGQPGWRADVRVGDYVEVTQTADLTGAQWARVRLHLRAPTDVPAGVAWEAWLIVDHRRAAGVRAWPGRERSVELWANVSKLSGNHVVGVRLVLVARDR